ncbi:hypothetical protein WR25_07411 [Diploscapter pachys]|uniref:DUF155 domain-containing protein n=1 Tax=Diploscapter pachys TaxID=2018661 RepID=A0A2A2KQX7_9BILA|nr:hypothetical protein WR25_07411 [Diploscapter pachys]
MIILISKTDLQIKTCGCGCNFFFGKSADFKIRKIASLVRNCLYLINDDCLQRQEPTVTALAIAEDFDLHGIANDLAINNLYNVTYIDEEFDDTLHLAKRMEYTIDPLGLSEIFVFRDGAVVFWNVRTHDRAALLRDVERFAKNPYESSIALEELDRMAFKIVDGNDTEIKNDRFCLSGLRHSAPTHRSTESILERFALSQAFAASVKIGVWEASLTNLAEPLSKTTRALTQGYIPWNRKETLKHSGEFAALRHMMNLDSNLLNQDFYWDRGNLESYYKIAARHFMLERRLNSLNSRIDYCEELVKMVDNMLALRHVGFFL